MKQKEFEDKFPSLRLLEQHTEYFGEIDYTREDVYKYCLDKQKVKDAWKRRLLKAKKMSETTNDARFANFANELFYDDMEELGLK